MKPLTAKQAIADLLAEGWPGDREAHRRAVSRLVEDGNDVLASNLAVAKEIKRLQIAGGELMHRVLRTLSDIDALAALLRSRKLPVTVSVSAGANRTNHQNRLQRKWCAEVAEQLADRTAEEVRGDAKLRFGVPILRAEHADFAEKYDRLIKPRPYAEKLEMMMEPIDFPVTRLMTTRQLTAYLDAFAAHYSAQGVHLTTPEAA